MAHFRCQCLNQGLIFLTWIQHHSVQCSAANPSFIYINFIFFLSVTFILKTLTCFYQDPYFCVGYSEMITNICLVQNWNWKILSFNYKNIWIEIQKGIFSFSTFVTDIRWSSLNQLGIWRMSLQLYTTAPKKTWGRLSYRFLINLVGPEIFTK